MKRPVRSVVRSVPIDFASAEPLHAQVYRHLRRLILENELRPGCFLPSTRTLAAALGISRNTVSNAYDALASEGLVTGRTGSGTLVGGRALLRRTPRRLNFRSILRSAHYPTRRIPVPDPDGNPLYIQS